MTSVKFSNTCHKHVMSENTYSLYVVTYLSACQGEGAVRVDTSLSSTRADLVNRDE